MVELGLLLMGAYMAFGFLFAIPFAWMRAEKLDDSARHASFAFRIVILPAAAALWPFLVFRLGRSWRSHAELFGPEHPLTQRKLRLLHGFLIAAVFPVAAGIAFLAFWYRHPGEEYKSLRKCLHLLLRSVFIRDGFSKS